MTLHSLLPSREVNSLPRSAPLRLSGLALCCLVALLLAASPAVAQEIEELGDAPNNDMERAEPMLSIDAGVNIVSRFIYRGINLGEAPQVQPRIALNIENFQIALWSSHPLAPRTDATENVASTERGANYREVLFWALYNIDVGVGTLTPYVQNHYNPNVGDLFDFDDGGGAHFLQTQLMFSGNERLPIDLLVGWVFYNDPGDSIYLEGGYRFSVSDLDFRAFAGGVPGESPFNGVTEDEPAITNIGLAASRSITLTDAYSLPVSVTFVFNPYTENAFAALGISLF